MAPTYGNLTNQDEEERVGLTSHAAQQGDNRRTMHSVSKDGYGQPARLYDGLPGSATASPEFPQYSDGEDEKHVPISSLKSSPSITSSIKSKLQRTFSINRVTPFPDPSYSAPPKPRFLPDFATSRWAIILLIVLLVLAVTGLSIALGVTIGQLQALQTTNGTDVSNSTSVSNNGTHISTSLIANASASGEFQGSVDGATVMTWGTELVTIKGGGAYDLTTTPTAGGQGATPSPTATISPTGGEYLAGGQDAQVMTWGTEVVTVKGGGANDATGTATTIWGRN